MVLGFFCFRFHLSRVFLFHGLFISLDKYFRLFSWRAIFFHRFLYSFLYRLCFNYRVLFYGIVCHFRNIAFSYNWFYFNWFSALFGAILYLTIIA